MMATGGGPPKIENLSYWEVQILNLVPVEAVEGLLGVAESAAEFNFECDNVSLKLIKFLFLYQ